MFRLLAIATSGLALAAAAQAAEVNITIGPELDRLTRSYGEREIRTLREDLRREVDRALEAAGPEAPQRVDLVIEAATPNQPTYIQMNRRTALSAWSYGLGGAHVTGTVVEADGSTTPISFRWYETNFWRSMPMGVWQDADIAFSRLAVNLAQGERPNRGPYKPNLSLRPAFELWR